MYRDLQLYCRLARNICPCRAAGPKAPSPRARCQGLRDDLRAVTSWRRGSPRSWHSPGAAGVMGEETAARKRNRCPVAKVSHREPRDVHTPTSSWDELHLMERISTSLQLLLALKYTLPSPFPTMSPTGNILRILFMLIMCIGPISANRDKN